MNSNTYKYYKNNIRFHEFSSRLGLIRTQNDARKYKTIIEF